MSLPASAKAIAFTVTRDRAAARAFYRDVLGFTLVSDDAYATVFDMNATMLRIAHVPGHVAQPHTVLGWDVPDIVAAVTSLREKGVVFTVHDGMGQDALGIWQPPGRTTRVAWFQDPDGNVLSLTEF